jgi:hypothetical protein
MWHVAAIVVSVLTAAAAFLRAGGLTGQSQQAIGFGVVAFLAAGAFVESVELFLFLAANRRLLERPLQGRYATLLTAAGLLMLATFFAAALALIGFGPQR